MFVFTKVPIVLGNAIAYVVREEYGLYMSDKIRPTFWSIAKYYVRVFPKAQKN